MVSRSRPKLKAIHAFLFTRARARERKVCFWFRLFCGFALVVRSVFVSSLSIPDQRLHLDMKVVSYIRHLTHAALRFGIAVNA